MATLLRFRERRGTLRINPWPLVCFILLFAFWAWAIYGLRVLLGEIGKWLAKVL
jgi:hypothetical protein